MSTVRSSKWNVALLIREHCFLNKMFSDYGLSLWSMVEWRHGSMGHDYYDKSAFVDVIIFQHNAPKGEPELNLSGNECIWRDM